MKKALYFACLAALLIAPWWGHLRHLHDIGGEQDLCAAESEVLALRGQQDSIRLWGILTYGFESDDTALLRFMGTIEQDIAGQERRYSVHRTAEVHYEIHRQHIKTRTLSAARAFADNAPDDLVYRYAHPALQPGVQYQARLYPLSAHSLASGTDDGLRSICTPIAHGKR